MIVAGCARGEDQFLNICSTTFETFVVDLNKGLCPQTFSPIDKTYLDMPGAIVDDKPTICGASASETPETYDECMSYDKDTNAWELQELKLGHGRSEHMASIIDEKWLLLGGVDIDQEEVFDMEICQDGAFVDLRASTPKAFINFGCQVIQNLWLKASS